MTGTGQRRLAPPRSSPSAPARDTAQRDLATLARGGTLNVVGLIANAVLGFAFAVVVARAVGAQGSGTLFLAVAAFTIVQSIAQMGADTGAMRTISRYVALERTSLAREVVRIGFWPVVGAGSVLGIALFALAPELSALISGSNRSQLADYLRILAVFVPISAGSAVLLAATRGLGAMLPFVAVERIGRAALRLALALGVVAAGLGSTGLLVVWAIPLAAGFVVAVIWLRALLARAEAAGGGRVQTAIPIREIARDFWSFSAYRGVATLFRLGILWLDVLLLGALASERDAGIYNAAARIVTAGSFGLQAILIVMGPQISGLLARREQARARAIFQQSTSWLTTLSLPFYLTTALFAPLLLSVFGPEFKAGSTALVILSLAMLLDMVTGPVTTVLLMAGKSSWNLINVIVTLAVNVALNAALIPSYGMTGAAIAWACSIVVQNGLPLVQVWRGLGLQPFSEQLVAAVLGPGLCYGLLGVALLLTLGATFPALAIYLACGSALYVGFLHRFRGTLALDSLWTALRQRATGAM